MSFERAQKWAVFCCPGLCAGALEVNQVKTRGYVAVIGGSVCSSEEESIAELVGKELAGNGFILVCGGRGGIMEAACRGAMSVNGITVGILPGCDRTEANPFLTVSIPTGLGEARNAIVVSSAEVVVAIGGGYGTLSEIGLALKTGKPVVGIHTWSFSRGNVLDKGVICCDTVEELIQRVRMLMKRTGCRILEVDERI